MTEFIEGNLRIRFPDWMTAEKFDDQASHGLSHCMKAVDFIVEVPNEYIAFIELKDPDNPDAPEAAKEEFLSEGLDHNLYCKYRDTFLYQWACDRLDRPVYYWVIIALGVLERQYLDRRADQLKRKLPLIGPESGNWKRPIVNGCSVFNIETWNQYQPDILLERIP